MIEERACEIIQKAYRREKSVGTVARLYGIAPATVRTYLRKEKAGTLPGRCVIRVEIARLQAIKDGCRFYPTDKDRYKGTREW